jgi:hypothetical protein
MKVREIEMILAEMDAINPENPQESLGENFGRKDTLINNMLPNRTLTKILCGYYGIAT